MLKFLVTKKEEAREKKRKDERGGAKGQAVPGKRSRKRLCDRIRVVYQHPTLDAQLIVADMKDYFPLVEKAIKESKPYFKTRCITIRGCVMKQRRQTCFMGGPGVTGFLYSGQYTEADPMSPAVAEIMTLVNEELGTAFNGALLNSYPADGKSTIGFHSDAETGLGAGSTVVSISFGGARKFRLKDKKTRKTLFDHMTGPCELMVMKGKHFQPHLLHGIPSQSKSMHRWSITFRMHAIESREGEKEEEEEEEEDS